MARSENRAPKILNSTFNTYTVGPLLGEGGTGRVFQVTDTSGQILAAKLLNPAKITEGKRRRFKNEVLFCQRTTHRNILQVIDHRPYLQDSISVPFYVMTHYSGTLRKLMGQGIPCEKALFYFSQLLDATEVAHLKKVTHRDIKPENVLYEEATDTLILADFGIARFGEDELYTAVESKSGERLANFQYAAPEQRIRGRKVDERADVYALGLILNELFTSVIPLGTGYKTVSTVASEYSYLDLLVEEMLRQNPDERIQSIEQIKQRLISNRVDFIEKQRLNELSNNVVKTSELDDPLIADPPRIINYKWENSQLTLFLSRPVGPKWVMALNNMGNYSLIMGKEPSVVSHK